MRQRVLCSFAAGLVAVSLLIAGSDSAIAGGGRDSATVSAVTPFTGATNAVRPANLPPGVSDGGSAEGGGGELELLRRNPPYPTGVDGFIIFTTEGALRTADDVVFSAPTPLVAVRIFYNDDNFGGDPDAPGSDFFLRIYEDDGTGTGPADPEIFASGPHNLGDGVLTVELSDTDAFGADTILGVMFNFGAEFFIADAGVKYWVGMTGTPPAGATQIGVAQSNTPNSSLEAMSQDGGGGWAPVDVGDPAQFIDMGMELFGFAPTGGVTVMTMSGTATNCTVRITPTTAPITACGAGTCATDPIYGPNCFAEANLAGVGPNEMAIALAIGLENAGGCNEFISAFPTETDQGPRLVVTTTDGTKPKLCVSINGVPQGILGGPNNCETDGCGLHFQVGPTLGTRLDPIKAGTDIFATPKDDCDLGGDDDTGTWANVVADGVLFDRDGLAPATGIDQRVRLSGVGRAFALDDSDTSVRRLEDIVFDQCSGDFSRPEAANQVFSPDGLVNGDDVAAFGQCNNTNSPFPGDCEFFDFDGNNTINDDDKFVLLCLQASGNSSECCPANLAFPQDASSTIPTELARRHLRGCDYVEVSRTGLQAPENWVLDYYLSAQDASVGADAIGDCEVGGAEGVTGNNVIANASSIGLISEGDPRQVSAAIGDFEGCDLAPFWPGDHDADVYSFTVAFPSNVVLRADALNNVNCACVGQNGVVSLWLFDDRGILLGQDDTAGAADPDLSVALDPGEYFIMVAAAGQISAPVPTGLPGDSNCSIANAPEIDAGATDPTGCYDLHLAVAPSSTLRVTQDTAAGGSLESRLLVQPLITYQRLCDPDHAVLLDTGDLGIDATVLEGSGSWVSALDAGSSVIAGDPGFVPGVNDNGGNQTSESIQYADLTSASAAHRVVPAQGRKCDTLFSGCAYSQSPDPDQGLAATGAIFSATQNFPLADDFTLDADAEISSVSFWVTPADIVGSDHVFVVRILGDTPAGAGEVCDGIPDENNIISEGTVGAPFVSENTMADVDTVTVNLANPFTAVAGTTYWLEFALDSDASPGAQVFFVTSLQGNGSFFHDIVPGAIGVGDGCNATVDGNGWDCTNVVDDDPLDDCDVTDADGDRRGDDPNTPDVVEIQNIAFCVGTQPAEVYTKDMPGDVAVGSWRQSPGQIVWSQPFALRDDGTVGFFSDFSVGTSGGNQAADSFTFFETATVTDVHWRGTYTANTPDPAADQFTIEFWSDGDNVPDGLLRFFAPSNAEIDRVSGTLSGDPGRQVFSYSYALTGPAFVVNANETIWLSVINNTAGQAYNWTFAIGGGGNANGTAALRAGLDNNPAWDALPDPGDPPTDFSFDITIEGNTKVICGDSVDCSANGSIASGLGYRFDPRVAVINGFSSKDGEPSSNGNRWRNVGAPWKMYNELDGGDVGQSELEALLAQIGGSTPQERNCLIEGVPSGATIAAVFSGLAAYDTDPVTNGISVTGEMQRLCNGAIAERVDPTVALGQRVNVKGVCWTDGSATFLTKPESPAAPELIHGCGNDGETAPRSGLIDPRQESSDGVATDLGRTEATLVFTRNVFKCNGSPIDASSFAISETGGGTPPTITSASASGATVTVTWDRAITLQEWTTISVVDVCDGEGTAVPNEGDLGVDANGDGINEKDRVDLGFLPCDVDQDGTVGPFDLLRFRQIVNGVFVPCEPPLDLTDINLNLASDPFDLLTFRQLINGVSPPSTRVWSGESMNNPQP